MPLVSWDWTRRVAVLMVWCGVMAAGVQVAKVRSAGEQTAHRRCTGRHEDSGLLTAGREGVPVACAARQGREACASPADGRGQSLVLRQWSPRKLKAAVMLLEAVLNQRGFERVEQIMNGGDGSRRDMAERPPMPRQRIDC